jgi:TonB family protein
MKTLCGIALLLLFSGCTAPRQAVLPEQQTELILLTPLPPLSSFATAFGAKLSVIFHILPDGSTKDVTLLNSSGDTEWDRLTLDSLKQWHFTPLTGEKEKADRWIRYAIVVQVQEPVIMQLAEMVIPAQRKADSLFALLKDGADFETLARQALTGEKEGTWKPAESVNLARYPARVKQVLTTLRPDHFTDPIRIGLNYVIFKRSPGP